MVVVRFEYQQRGNSHLHGMARFEHAPDLIRKTEIMLEGLNAQQGWGENGSDQIPVEQLEEAIKRAEEARKECIKFLDWFATTSDPSLPDLSQEEARRNKPTA